MYLARVIFVLCLAPSLIESRFYLLPVRYVIQLTSHSLKVLPLYFMWFNVSSPLPTPGAYTISKRSLQLKFIAIWYADRIHIGVISAPINCNSYDNHVLTEVHHEKIFMLILSLNENDNLNLLVLFLLVRGDTMMMLK